MVLLAMAERPNALVDAGVVGIAWSVTRRPLVAARARRTGRLHQVRPPRELKRPCSAIETDEAPSGQLFTVVTPATGR